VRTGAQMAASATNSKEFGLEITGGPVVIDANAVSLVPGVFTDEVCAGLIVPGA
jgi:hypothetical protein